MKFTPVAISVAVALHSSSAFTVSLDCISPVLKRDVFHTENNYFRRTQRRERLAVLAAEATKITMPALSSTMKEGRVVSWLKGEGDAVSAGEAIMVVESDKADMDVEAFEDGYIAKILIAEGETAPVGEVVALLASEESDIELVAAMAGGNVDGVSSVSSASTSSPNTPTVLGSVPTFAFSQIDMPALSSTMKEGKVVSWLKAEGDKISSGEAIMVVESDKADMDVEAFEDGFLAAIITGEGEVGAVGAPVALIAQDEADIPSLQAYAASLKGLPAPIETKPAVVSTPASPKSVTPIAVKAPTIDKDSSRIIASPAAKTRAQELGVNLSTVSGTGPDGRITLADVEKASSAPVSTGSKAGDQSKEAVSKKDVKPSWTPAPGVIAATPTARALAKKAKLDLSTIKGTGEFGRVTIDDVKIATGEKKPERKTVVKSSSTSAVELPEGLVKFTGMQRAVSKNMEATLSTPVFRVSREIEMDKFDDLYQQLKPKGVTVSALLAKAVALALAKFPIINSSYSTEGTVYNKDINIAMAVAIDGGLITPVLKYANERSIVELGENWKELVQKAKDGKLTPDEYQTGTFTISNLGMFGVTQFDAILPKGMGGILAIGSTQEVIVPCHQAVLGMKKVKKMTVTLTCDHRQIYGADGALFLKELANVMEFKLDALSR